MDYLKMDLNGNASAGVGKDQVVVLGKSNSKTPSMGRDNDKREVVKVAKIKEKKRKSGGGDGSGCAAAGEPEPTPTPSCSKKKSVLSRFKQKLCYLKDEKLLKEFDQFWICQECGHFFELQDSLWSHIHDHLYNYNCKQCTEPGSQELKSSAMRCHIRKCHPLIDKLSDGYIRKKALDWDDAVIALKTKKKNFLTVEQLRNSNPEKYDQLKTLTFGIGVGRKRAKVKVNDNGKENEDDDESEWTFSNNGLRRKKARNRLSIDSDVDDDDDDSQEELAGGGGAVSGRVGYSLKARAKVTQTKEDEDDFVDILGVDEDDTAIAPQNLCKMVSSPEAESVAEDEDPQKDWDTATVEGVPIHELVLHPDDQEDEASSSSMKTETELFFGDDNNSHQQDQNQTVYEDQAARHDVEVEERSPSSSITSSVSSFWEEASTNQAGIHQETQKVKKKNKKCKIPKVIPHTKRLPRHWHPYWGN